MRERARIVIVGGGIAGASIAYHLAELGWRDVIVLDQGPLVGGTTSHAPGLVGQLRSSRSLTRMLMTSVELYRRLRLDGEAGFMGERSLRVASSKARWVRLRQEADAARGFGLEVHTVSPQEAGRLFPLMSLEGVEGGVIVPGDGSASAVVLAGALIRAAEAAGVMFYPGTAVRNINVAGGRVRAVETDQGRIETETLVVAAGIWSPQVGRLAGVQLPLTPLQHQYVVTAPQEDLRGVIVPNLRDPDNRFYLRQNGPALVIGGYERPARPWDVDAIPGGPNPTIQAFDATQFEPIRRGACERIPALRSINFARRVNGLEAFTPDGEFLLGPVPEVDGFWSACGFCAHGVSGAGGVGKVMAEWIVHGDPGLDIAAMDVRRFRGHSLDRAAIQRAAGEVYGSYYEMRG